MFTFCPKECIFKCIGFNRALSWFGWNEKASWRLVCACQQQNSSQWRATISTNILQTCILLTKWHIWLRNWNPIKQGPHPLVWKNFDLTDKSTSLVLLEGGGFLLIEHFLTENIHSYSFIAGKPDNAKAMNLDRIQDTFSEDNSQSFYFSTGFIRCIFVFLTDIQTAARPDIMSKLLFTDNRKNTIHYYYRSSICSAQGW